MTQSAAALASALSATSLANRAIAEAPIRDTGEVAYAMEIKPHELESAWRDARKLVDVTGRWPLVITYWTGGPATTFADRLKQEDLFDRWPYEQNAQPPGADVSPAAILRGADRADVRAFLDGIAVRRDRAWPLSRALKYQLEATGRLCGSEPSQAELHAARIDGRPLSNVYDLDRWLLEWEQRHGKSRNPLDARQPWFDPGPVLLFMPVSNSWDSLAYLHWWGLYRGAEPYIALGREWNRRYGAELVAHYGTMLQCFVTSPPKTIDEAWPLAREHDLFAPCTLALPGCLVRHYAGGLVDGDRWFFHERP